MAKENILDIIAKGATSFIKSKTQQEQSKLKMKSALALEGIKHKMNFMYKAAEKAQVTPYQQMVGNIAQKEYPEMDFSAVTGGKDRMPYGAMNAGGGQGGGPGVGQGGAPGAVPPEMEGGGAPSRFGVTFGASGMGLKERGLKGIVEKIYMKPQDDWTAKEKQLVSQYKDMTAKGVTATQQRKEDIQKKEVLEVLGRGTWFSEAQGKQIPFKDRQEAMDFLIDNYEIDVTDPEIQEVLAQYKPAEEDITPAGGGFMGMGKRKYDTKEKYGYNYERREDNKWHRID